MGKHIEVMADCKSALYFATDPCGPTPFRRRGGAFGCPCPISEGARRTTIKVLGRRSAAREAIDDLAAAIVDLQHVLLLDYEDEYEVSGRYQQSLCEEIHSGLMFVRSDVQDTRNCSVNGRSERRLRRSQRTGRCRPRPMIQQTCAYVRMVLSRKSFPIPDASDVPNVDGQRRRDDSPSGCALAKRYRCQLHLAVQTLRLNRR